MRMFVWSVRSSTLKFTAVLAAGVLAVLALVIFLPGAEPPAQKVSGQAPENLRLDGLEKAEDMADLLAVCGWKAELPPMLDQKVVLPEDFKGVFPEYAAIQRAQGLDLEKAAGKEVRKVTFVVRDPKGEERRTATLFVLRGRLIGADLTAIGRESAAEPLLPTS